MLNNPDAPESMKAKARLNIAEKTLPELDAYEYWLVSTFWSISHGRVQGDRGPKPLSFQDLVAYQQLLRVELNPIEAEIIKMADDAYLTAYYSEARKEQT